MKPKNKLIAGIAVLVGSIGLATNLGDRVETDCETYQGYRDDLSDGERIFVFDEKPREERLGGPNYALSGDPRMYKDLEIGDKYRLKIREPLMGSNRLIYTEDCD